MITPALSIDVSWCKFFVIICCNSSARELFLSACNFDKGISGYLKCGCVSNKSKQCKFVQSPKLKYHESSQLDTIYQIEIIKSKYKVNDKTNGEFTENISNRTVSVSISVLIVSKKHILSANTKLLMMLMNGHWF